MSHFRFLREALDEYADAIEYYERVQPGLGDTFVRDVERVLAVTLEFPEIGVRVAETPAELNVRRRLVERFGVEIDYVVAADEIVVLAIFHGKRRPGYWRERLGVIKWK